MMRAFGSSAPRGLSHTLYRIVLPLGGALATAALLTAAFRIPPKHQSVREAHVTAKGEVFRARSVLSAPSVLAFSTAGGSSGAQSSSSPLADAVLRDRDGKVVDASALKGKSVALLFAASWCPSCVQYSPSILAFYEAVNSKEPGKRPIEIVMVSSDLSKEAMDQHMRPYPWLAVDFDGPARAALKRRYKVWAMRENGEFGGGRDSGIPTLVVIDDRGEELERIRLEMSGVKGLQQWRFQDWAWR